MTETTRTTTRMRKYPQIELPRPGLSWRSFWVTLALCTLGSVLLGVIMWAAQGIGGDHVGNAEGDFPAVYYLGPTWKFVGASIGMAILAGLGLGWAWKRPVSPRIEMYEVDTTSQVTKRGRRRTTTTLTRTTS